MGRRSHRIISVAADDAGLVMAAVGVLLYLVAVALAAAGAPGIAADSAQRVLFGALGTGAAGFLFGVVLALMVRVIGGIRVELEPLAQAQPAVPPLPPLVGAAPDDALLNASPDEWKRFTDVAAAREAGWPTLIRCIGGARSQDPTGYQLIREALLGLDPTFSVNIRCDRECASLGPDQVTLSATGHHSRSEGFGMRRGNTSTLSFRLVDVFDLDRIDSRATLTIAAEVGGIFVSLRGSLGWVFPWAAFDTFLTPADRDQGGHSRAYHLSGSVQPHSSDTP